MRSGSSTGRRFGAIGRRSVSALWPKRYFETCTSGLCTKRGLTIDLTVVCAVGARRVKASDQWAGGALDMAGRAEKLLPYDQAGKVAIAVEDVWNLDLLLAEQEFVDVDQRDPAGIAPLPANAVRIGRYLSDRDRPGRQGDETGGDVGSKHVAEIVGGEVVVEIEMRGADAAVELDPLRQERRFLAEDRTDRQPVADVVRVASLAPAGAPQQRQPQHGAGAPAQSVQRPFHRICHCCLLPQRRVLLNGGAVRQEIAVAGGFGFL